MLFATILALLPLAVSAIPASKLFERQIICYGCIYESSCTGNVGDLTMGGNAQVAQAMTMWLDQFGSDGSIANNDVAYDKGVCCGDWCIVMENTASYDIPYTLADVQAIDFTQQGDCSKYYDKVNDNYYLKLVCASSTYTGGDDKSIVQEYGDSCAGAGPWNGPAPDGYGFS